MNFQFINETFILEKASCKDPMSNLFSHTRLTMKWVPVIFFPFEVIKDNRKVEFELRVIWYISNPWMSTLSYVNEFDQ